MDFVEKIFGISPDNGSGTFEASILLAVAALIAALFWVRRKRASRSRDN